MNRRNFLGKLLVAGAGFAVLPPATTYGRIWRAKRELPGIEWLVTESEVELMMPAGNGFQMPFCKLIFLSSSADGRILELS